MKSIVLVYKIKDSDVIINKSLSEIVYICLHIHKEHSYINLITKKELKYITFEEFNDYYIDINIKEYNKRSDKISYIKELYPEYFL